MLGANVLTPHQAAIYSEHADFAAQGKRLALLSWGRRRIVFPAIRPVMTPVLRSTEPVLVPVRTTTRIETSVTTARAANRDWAMCAFQTLGVVAATLR